MMGLDISEEQKLHHHHDCCSIIIIYSFFWLSQLRPPSPPLHVSMFFFGRNFHHLFHTRICRMMEQHWGQQALVGLLTT